MSKVKCKNPAMYDKCVGGCGPWCSGYIENDKVKPCFGKYESFDISWHCLGCFLKEECKLCAEQTERKN